MIWKRTKIVPNSERESCVAVKPAELEAEVSHLYRELAVEVNYLYIDLGVNRGPQKMAKKTTKGMKANKRPNLQRRAHQVGKRKVNLQVKIRENPKRL